MTFSVDPQAKFETMSLKEEFEMFVDDALYGTNVNREELLSLFCNNHLGIAYTDENLEELMEAVVDEPYILNDYADFLDKDLQA